MRITIKQELYLITEILTRMGVSEEDAAIVAEVTADADLKGFSSHGIGRFPSISKDSKWAPSTPSRSNSRKGKPSHSLIKRKPWLWTRYSLQRNEDGHRKGEKHGYRYGGHQ